MPKVPEAVSQFYNKVSSNASSCARAAGEKFSKVGASLRAMAAKVAQTASLYWHSLKRGISENQRPILAVVGGLAVASVIGLLVSQVFKKSQPAKP